MCPPQGSCFETAATGSKEYKTGVTIADTPAPKSFMPKTAEELIVVPNKMPSFEDDRL